MREQACYWFVFDDSGLILRKESADAYSLPLSADPPCPIGEQLFDLDDMNGVPCRAAKAMESRCGEGFESIGRRTAYAFLNKEFQHKAAKGFQHLHWDEYTRYCPHCGAATIKDELPLSKRCPDCGHLQFPNPVSAIIVLVYKDDGTILLAHSHSFKGPFYSCLAGYVEQGESLEECVRREVHEETGITVEDIRYFGSQPWPFPNTLMIGFTARYKEGEIVLQESELSAAGFYGRDDLPELPRKRSLARMLIDAWLDNTHLS